MIRKA